MPTYGFNCIACGADWRLSQKMGEPHVSECPKCGKTCTSDSFGGTGVQFAGRHFTNQLTGFPDNTRMNNKAVDKLAEDSEKEAAAYDKTLSPENMELAKEVSASKRKNRSSRFREKGN